MPLPQSRFVRRACGLVTLAPAMGTALTLAGAASGAFAQAAGDHWTVPAGTVQGTRYSKLNAINSGNVSTLVEEFKFDTGTVNGHEGQPLVVGDTMYVVTPFPNKLIALDLRHPGTAKWTYNPGTDIFATGKACCDVVNRGATYADGKIVYNLLDGHTVAVDAQTGVEVWRATVADPTIGEVVTGPTLVVGNKVILGNSGGEFGVRGWVQALDLATGLPVWKAYNTGPDADVLIGADFHPFYAKDRGKDLGVATWPGDMWKLGGSTSWGWLSYDPDANLFYYGTANPGVWNPDMRPGDNKWGSTIWARNPDTGMAAWAYQVTPHESWDYDSIGESIVANITVDGKKRKVIVHFDKNGFAYTIDRFTGEVIKAPKFGHVTWADHVDLATGLPAVNPGKEPHQGKITDNICPTPTGVKDQEPSAFSPDTGLFYVPTLNFCNNFEPLKAKYIQGAPFMGNNNVFLPGPGGFGGELLAWNASTGQKAWAVEETFPVYSGVLATAGNLVFYGTLDSKFKALNATTGKVLFEAQLECGIMGSPMTYTAPDGRQRVAVYTGTGNLAGGFVGGPCPGQGADAARGAQGALAQAIAGMKVKAPAPPSKPPTSGAVHVFMLP
jgi:alcohol dehydrogenase (cytochrome c)